MRERESKSGLQSTITELENKTNKTTEEQEKLNELKTQLANYNKPAVEDNNHLLYWTISIVGIGLLALIIFLIIRKNKQ